MNKTGTQAFRLHQPQPASHRWRAYLNDMLKRIRIIGLFVFLSFAFMACHHNKEQEEGAQLPSLRITMTSLQLDSILATSDNKVAAYALLTDANGDTLYEDSLTHMKARGNTSFKEYKKPFAVKFPTKQVFWGLDRGRSFVLLANALDESHIRNAMAFDLARAMGIPAPRYAYLTLYINGTYWGLYQMTNKIHIGKDALDIVDLDKRNEWYNPKPLDEYEWFGKGRKGRLIQRKGVLLDCDPDNITGGYLLDNTGPQPPYQRSFSGFISDSDDHIRILSPKHASPKELEYIANRYNEMESAVLAFDGVNPETGKHYSEYLDVESFVRYYLLNELLLNWDGGWSSFLMYKDIDLNDPKFHAGPAWDFDRALDNHLPPKGTLGFPNELFVCERKGRVGFAGSGGLLYRLCQHEDFRQMVTDCYLNEISATCHAYLEKSPFDSLAALLSREADRDNAKYDTRQSADYAAAVMQVTDFLRKRVAFFDSYFSSMEEGHVLVRFEWRYQRYLTFSYPIGEPVNAPQVKKVVNNADPVFVLYDPETASYIPDGTVFHAPKELELREREPAKREVQKRRIKKKLRKIGIDF